MQTYLNDYLSQEKGFSVQMATVVILVFGLTGGGGVVAGGWAGQWMYNRCVCEGGWEGGS
jgi:predicted MFS family arabinose efflux permease